MTMNSHGCEFPPDGAFPAASRIRWILWGSTESGLSRRMLRSVLMASKTGISMITRSLDENLHSVPYGFDSGAALMDLACEYGNFICRSILNALRNV